MSNRKIIEIPTTAKVYEFDPLVEICGNCGGTGANFTDSEGNVCQLCNGSGRVIKKKTVVIDIKPYED